MGLDQQQSSYLDKRRKLLKAWRYIGPLTLIIIIGFATYLYINTPLLINPYEVLSGLESDSISQSTLEIMAALLPIMFITACFLLIVFVIMMYAAFSNERKYLIIIEEIKSSDNDVR